jgi:hypothetical protein
MWLIIFATPFYWLHRSKRLFLFEPLATVQMRCLTRSEVARACQLIPAASEVALMKPIKVGRVATGSVRRSPAAARRLGRLGQIRPHRTA